MYSLLRAVTQRNHTSLNFIGVHIQNGKSLWFNKASNLRATNLVFFSAKNELIAHNKAANGLINKLEPNNSSEVGTGEIEPIANQKIPYTDICAIPPTLTLVQHVNTSEVLSELVKLGVSIHKVDKTPKVRESVLKLSMEDHIKPILMFFMNHDIPLDCIGDLINKCPYTLLLSTYQMENFSAYMKSKNFTPEMIKKILMKSPHLLQKSIEKTDYHLGLLQKTFDLSGKDLRTIVTREPKLVSLEKQTLEHRNYALEEEMGFDEFQIKQLITNKPRLWVLNAVSLRNRFDYIHNVMGLSHEVIVQFPAVLTCREYRLRARHQFLQFLGRAQYDPKLPLYVNPLEIVRDSDANFALCVAKSSIDNFNDFCKTL